MIVRRATEVDVPALLEIAQTFIAESRYGWTYCEDLARYSFETRVAADVAAVLVPDDGGALAGLSIVLHDRDYCVQRLGYVEKFYVMPGYRGTGAGRLLAEASVRWFQDHLCWAAFCTATGNIGQDRAFVNLFRKYGFVECGATLMRDFAHE